MCSGSEAVSYLRLIDFVYHSTLDLKVIKKKKKFRVERDDLPKGRLRKLLFTQIGQLEHWVQVDKFTPFLVKLSVRYTRKKRWNSRFMVYGSWFMIYDL